MTAIPPERHSHPFNCLIEFLVSNLHSVTLTALVLQEPKERQPKNGQHSDVAYANPHMSASPSSRFAQRDSVTLTEDKLRNPPRQVHQALEELNHEI